MRAAAAGWCRGLQRYLAARQPWTHQRVRIEQVELREGEVGQAHAACEARGKARRALPPRRLCPGGQRAEGVQLGGGAQRVAAQQGQQVALLHGHQPGGVQGGSRGEVAQRQGARGAPQRGAAARRRHVEQGEAVSGAHRVQQGGRDQLQRLGRLRQGGRGQEGVGGSRSEQAWHARPQHFKDRSRA
jgi:hypothetical protein